MSPLVSVIASRLGLVVVAALLAGAASAQRAVPTASSLQASVAVDTLRYSVRAGETLIVGLPARVAGVEVDYEIDEAPALSWLVDRSFMWRTLAQERGTLPVRLRRTASGRADDVVVLLVEITP